MIRKFCFFLLIGCLFSCAPAPRLPVVAPEVSKTELLGVLADNATSFTSLKGVARISLREEGEKTVKGKHILLVKKPRRVRTEILGLFGQPMAVAVVDGGSASLLVPRERVLYTGEASPRNIQRILRIPLEVKDLVNFILYQVPVIVYRSAVLNPLPGNGFRLILQGKGSVEEELDFDAGKKLVKALFRNGSEEVLTVRYGNFSEGENPFPQRLELSLPQRGTEARVEFSSLQTNVDIDDGLFRLEKPEGFQVRPLL
jgi:hypothetical protein